MSSTFIRPVPAVDNLNSLIPPPPPGAINVIFQATQGNPRNVTAYFFPNSAGVNLVATASYTIQSSDQGKLVVMTSPSASVIADSSLGANFGTNVLFAGASGGMITPSTGQLNTRASLSFWQWAGGLLNFDGSNWWLLGTPSGQVEQRLPTFAIRAGAGGSGVNVTNMLRVPQQSLVTACDVVVKASDASTDFTFRIMRNGVDIFSSDPTVTHGATSGSSFTFAALVNNPFLLNAGDILSLDITSGSASWDVTVQLRS